MLPKRNKIFRVGLSSNFHEYQHPPPVLCLAAFGVGIHLTCRTDDLGLHVIRCAGRNATEFPIRKNAARATVQSSFCYEKDGAMPTLVVGMRIHREIHGMPTQAWAWHPEFSFSATETK
jgi:hypothetical protein